ncbi:D-alanyl-lipoteichoic acid acyltransferase DltB, MBOAT superfamily [Lachnospiraceae bacterium XBD2001]|nr:D-alanyl-lipoteichoic acid acyltransferase DltB, MBOAT superfamily [Lachnospiraceae bacterium XBD2001]
MIYISFYYFVLVIGLVCLYYLLPLKRRWIVLLMGNLLFYVAVSRASIAKFSVLILMSFLAWGFGQLMNKDETHKKLYLICALITDTIPPLIFKQLPYAVDKFIHREMPGWWFVPLGISFFALQLIAYDVDIYKGKTKGQKNYLKFLLFASFFPQVVQGPIPRYEQLSHQLTEGNRFSEEKFVRGFLYILWGFFLKLCIADKAGIVVDTVFNQCGTYQGVYVLVAGILYSVQLYADFLACTSLAQGVAWLFGIEIIDNFMRPYFATSIKDFWRRWHISLSSWLRDYIYIPLGGNRKGTVRKYINLAVTFAVSGIWHGAGVKFLLWGMLHGFYQITGDLLQPIRSKVRLFLHIDEKRMYYRVLSQIITFVLVMFAWIIFRANGFREAIYMIRSVFTVYNPWVLTNGTLFNLGLDVREWHVLLFSIVVLFGIGTLKEKGISISRKICSWALPIRWLSYLAIIVFVMLYGTYGFGYDAQAFIYGGF